MLLDDFLPQIASRLYDGLEVRDRRFRLKTYQTCFVASEAVDFMMQNQIVDSRQEAVKLGLRLQKKMGFWHHVCDDHDFDDRYLFFRFAADDTDANEDVGCTSEREYTEDELYDIADDLKVCLDIQDRTYRLKKYKKCFVATEAVDVMIENGMADTREEAVLVGRHLQKKQHLWNHVCDDHLFDDKYFFFRFLSDNDDCDKKGKTTKKKLSRLRWRSNVK